ncbi:SepF, FtsZ-interacting protein related to cell division [Candidatus Syntrophocurvum alkaliphilum]|uniref:Cell division protein SepF n=1 Tax=Candidatus Syntrophocurvum alkaliphilum TaxID=2293317 RepID=A0A6I6DHD1_9FIRM|nr:cell division protein SepF [Candidatus Syntrophocurvum alkaliphilum]QGT99693.1 SepF, FtsZ-interacting protein related to cell division [Candidatus Syntrophocurvum alkaliphilum]
MTVIDKFWNMIGVQNEVEEEILEFPTDEEENRNNNNIVSIHTNKTMKVIVCEPESFDEVQVLADHIKNRKQVIINFEKTAPEVSQRIIDFISGATYSVEGKSQQVGKSIFIFTPSNFEIATDHRSLMQKHKINTRVFEVKNSE